MVAYRLHHTALKMCIVTYHGVFVQENVEQNGHMGNNLFLLFYMNNYMQEAVFSSASK